MSEKEEVKTAPEEASKILTSNALGQVLVAVAAGYQYSARVSEVLGKSPSMIKKQIDTLKKIGLLLEGEVDFGNVKIYTINEEFMKFILVKVWIEATAAILWESKLLLSNEKVEELKESLEESGLTRIWLEFFKRYSKYIVLQIEEMTEEQKRDFFETFNLSLNNILTTFFISLLVLLYRSGNEETMNEIVNVLSVFLKPSIEILRDILTKR